MATFCVDIRYMFSTLAPDIYRRCKILTQNCVKVELYSSIQFPMLLLYTIMATLRIESSFTTSILLNRISCYNCTPFIYVGGEIVGDKVIIIFRFDGISTNFNPSILTLDRVRLNKKNVSDS